MPFFVSRQKYHHDGLPYVEVAGGGLDYANPDMLVAAYSKLGEGETFDDPVEAVEAAIEVVLAWRKDTRIRPMDIRICFGFTGGFTLPFDRATFVEARKWAKKERAKLPRCSYCDKILGLKKWQHPLADDARFCSERCADDDYTWHLREDGADLEA